jgi:error-prone DNA polymerase
MAGCLLMHSNNGICMATLANPTLSNPRPEFAELHCISNYSFLRGASDPEALVQRAAELGYKAIAITDECTFSGVVKAHMAAKEHGIKLIIGAEFVLRATNDQPADAIESIGKVILLAPHREAYGQLSAFISKLRRRSPKGEYYLEPNDLRWGLNDCLALWVPGESDISTLITHGQMLHRLLPNLWLALELFHEDIDLDKTANLLALAIRLQLPIVASNDVHMHKPGCQPLQDVLTAIKHRTTVADLGNLGLTNSERHLRSIERLQSLYPVEMLEESAAIAERCHFSMNELRYEYPQELVPPHLTPMTYLRQLTMAGAKIRWPQGIPQDTLELIEKELVLIAQLEYEYYFLTVQDIVQFARDQGILCQGRGSAANSAVCYCLHITEVDPSRMHLLFERFVSKERDEPPDIDVDFEHERREEVIQYLYKRYSRDRAALAATLITYRPKSAVRDVGKALGMDLDLVDLLAKSLAWWDDKAALGERLTSAGLDPQSQLAQQFVYLINAILGFPRHLSQHVGGFVISRGPLTQLVPVENASMPDRTVIQWDKNDLEALGLMKVDVLGLGMLTAIRKALDHLNALPAHVRRYSQPLTIDQIPAEDPNTYAMLQAGDSIGVFQVESRAQMAMLPRLKPQHFYDLVVEVAIVRPGPIQGDMVHPYLRRRQGLEPVTYPSEAVRKVLERTLGIPIFQEQVIELAMVAAGFSAGEADQLRRAMAAWKRRGGLEVFEQKLVDGMLARGHDKDFAQRIFQQIQGFGEYGFPESHAASFALLVYISAWLKCHEPAAFYCGLLNSLPMGFYSASQLIQDAKRHHIVVLPADVQHSGWDCELDCPNQEQRDPGQQDQAQQPSPQPQLRLGLRLVKGLTQSTADCIAEQAPFRDIADLASRAGLNDQSLRFLARADALLSLSGHRYQAHWDAAGVQRPTELQAIAQNPEPYNTNVTLAEPSVAEDVMADYQYLGLSLRAHPMQLLRKDVNNKVAMNAAGRRTYPSSNLVDCRQGQLVRVAGLVTGRQRPSTATGVLFVTLEDESGNMNIVVWSSVLQRYRAELLQGQLLMIKGVVERANEVIHVVAGVVENYTGLLGSLQEPGESPFKSRNFH